MHDVIIWIRISTEVLEPKRTFMEAVWFNYWRNMVFTLVTTLLGRWFWISLRRSPRLSWFSGLHHSHSSDDSNSSKSRCRGSMQKASAMSKSLEFRQTQILPVEVWLMIWPSCCSTRAFGSTISARVRTDVDVISCPFEVMVLKFPKPKTGTSVCEVAPLEKRKRNWCSRGGNELSRILEIKHEDEKLGMWHKVWSWDLKDGGMGVRWAFGNKERKQQSYNRLEIWEMTRF